MRSVSCPELPWWGVCERPPLARPDSRTAVPLQAMRGQQSCLCSPDHGHLWATSPNSAFIFNSKQVPRD